MRRTHRLLVGTLIACGTAAPLAAEQVPGRDLWDFPVGSLSDAPALVGATGGGLYNPASAQQSGVPRGRAVLGVTALAASADQGVDGQLVHATWFRTDASALTVSIARSAISGIVRTGTDPSSLGNVPYDSWVTSIASSHAVGRHVIVGAAGRFRTGRADTETGRSIAGDVGVILQHLPVLDARVGASTFLWRPGRETVDRAVVNVAGDVRVLGSRDARGLRLGTSAQWARRGSAERFSYARARFELLELVAGSATTRRFGDRNVRARFGINFHFARYSAGIAREDGVSRLAPTYQFSLTSVLP
ncbi:MAG: hypothetical protein MUF00_20375 [Gemmatimonadaceae bacterium]|nr:hypothetical protein [Gemmatimonadaceae bacterium]